MSESQRTITCPSGMQGVIKKLPIMELMKLADADRRKVLNINLPILKATWAETLDPGCYSFPEKDGRAFMDWDRVLVGDQVFIALQVRALCFGAEWDFPFGCEHCGQPTSDTFDITKAVIKPLSDDARAKVASGECFVDFVGDDEQEVHFVLGTTAMQMAYLAKSMRGKNKEAQVELYVRRITDLPGYDGGTGNKGSDIRKWLEEVDADIFDELEVVLDEHDCGVETEIEALCKRCRGISEVELPLGKLFEGSGRAKAAKRRLTKRREKRKRRSA